MKLKLLTADYFRGMGKNKLRRFAENETFSNLIQPTRADVVNGLPLKSRWHKDFFKNNNPIVLELGCGRGDYAVGLARMFPEKNFVGIDIKGARLWRGAKTGLEENLGNLGFLRTQIELVTQCFEPGEVSEIWITFPDPQIRHRRAKHRLVHPDFIARYQKILAPGGKIHLKSDSEFLHGYLHGLLHYMQYPIVETYHDIHEQLRHEPNHILFTIKTFYEEMWLSQGKAITYICFTPEKYG